MKPIRVINLIAFLFVLGLNGWAGSVGLNGNTVGSVSDDILSRFTPAGYVFAIWGLIYIALGCFVVYGLLKSQRENTWIDRVGIWFALSCLFNMLWLVVWLMEIFWVSEVFMLLLLGSLIMLYLKLNAQSSFKLLPRKDFWLVAAPFSLYLGWISVATIANTSVLLYSLGVTRMGVTPEFWAIFMLLVAYILTIAMIELRHDWVFTFVVIWAAIGIGVKNSPSAVLSIATIIVAVGLTAALFYDRKNRPFSIKIPHA